MKNEGLDHNESNLDFAFVSGSCTQPRIQIATKSILVTITINK